MQTYVVYLYEKVSNIHLELNKYSEGLFTFDPLPVVGIISNNSIDVPNRKSIVESLNLKPFEIIQNHFDLFIRKSKQLNVTIKQIQFTNEIEFDLEEEIDEAIELKDYEVLFKLIKEVRDDHVDIFSITFLYDGKSYRMTKHAVAEVLGESNDVPDIIVKSPLSLIAGLKKFPSSEYM
ncbi:hypothetical protein BK139_13300 [Paenibacillus sp. FSL R5-0490]|uniref:hypothetical protein n=1 Tax=Paenibacillus sp. FSL R5-0490 TaxID=1920424 RepID=UPI00096F60AE|nr:hypothetical protein [Paenibacillus sp. FSL R5-0490]OMF59368.1 hypothetical protein BK139_13300 [Paenibacillus sp. FSL R5-0490]